MSADGKRKNPRTPVEIRVDYQRFNRFVSEYTRDISRGGLFIRTEDPLQVGEEIYLTLTFPHHSDGVTVMASVVRVDAPTESATPGMGVRFLFADAQERQSLFRLIDGLIVKHLGEELYRRLTGTADADNTSSFDTRELTVEPDNSLSGD